MNFWPYTKRHYQTDLKPDEIRNRVEKSIVKPDWNITLKKAISNRILEGEVSDNSFIVVMGRYGMTYGRTSLLPYLSGRIKYDAASKTRLDIIIQQSRGSGLLIISLVYAIAAFAIYISWTKNKFAGVIGPTFLMLAIYISILTKFNRERKTYIDFIEIDILRLRF